MKLKIKKLHPDAIIPRFAHEGDACFDLHAIDVDNVESHPRDFYAAIFQTGIAVEIPLGYAMLIFSRSGQGFKDAMRLSNCVGVIDAPYRGQIKVSLRADGQTYSKVRNGDRIAQAMIIKLPDVQIEVVDELSDSVRGENGFGSSGK